MAVGREQRILSIADDATLRTMSDTLLQLTVQYKGRDTHYLVLTHLVRPVLG